MKKKPSHKLIKTSYSGPIIAHMGKLSKQNTKNIPNMSIPSSTTPHDLDLKRGRGRRFIIYEEGNKE